MQEIDEKRDTMSIINARVEISRSQIKRLIDTQTHPLFNDILRGLAISSIKIPAGTTPEQQKRLVDEAINSIRELMKAHEARKANIGQVERAHELTTLLNQNKDSLEPFIPVLNDILEAGFHTILKKEHGEWCFEVLVRKPNSAVAVAAQRDPQLAAHVSPGGRFRPDVVTYLDGTPIDVPATEVLRREEHKNTRAFLDQKLVDTKKAKGLRSSVFIGMDANADGNGLPLFRAWVFKRDKNGSIILNNGAPICEEIEAVSSRYVTDLSLNKVKWASLKMAEVRAKYPAPKLTSKHYAEALREHSETVGLAQQGVPAKTEYNPFGIMVLE